MRLRKRAALGFLALLLAGLSAPDARAGGVPPTATAPAHAASRRITIMSFNVCGGMCRHGEVSGTAAHVTATALTSGATAVLLQELCYTQYLRIREGLGAHGFTGRFAASTRSRACAGDDRRHGTAFGVAALVRGGITESVVRPLPTSPGFERRALLGVTTRIGGRPTFVVVVHLSPSPAAGLDGQLAVLARYLDGRADRPSIVGGDFNALPAKPGLARLYSGAAGGTGRFVEADELRDRHPARGGAPTFDVAGRKIDYVFLSEDAFGTPSATSTPTPFSDHRVYVAHARLTTR